ncbi:hypothetical protein BC628DRAFT_1187410 [Trametes gibbosa]|nr:hypothetical protein BC628DRAFT_1187410 [Trametes gibbosa]
MNRTIDDETGDSVTGVKPVYAPDNLNWIQGLTCVHCTLLPYKVIDVSQTFGGTWHDCTYHPGTPDRTIAASFTGTAVYVYLIVPNTVPWTTTFMNLSFSIDNIYYNQYEHTPDNSSTINYKVLAFQAPNLANIEHNIEIRATGPSDSLFLFDYMEYTVGEAPESVASKSTSLLPPDTTAVPTSSIQPQPTTSSVAVSASDSRNTEVSPTTSSSASETSRPDSQHPVPIGSTSLSSSSGSSPTAETGGSTNVNGSHLGGSDYNTSTRSESSSPTGFLQSNPQAHGRSSSSGRIGPIAGGIAGGLAVLVVLLILYRYFRRLRRSATTRRKFATNNSEKLQSVGAECERADRALPAAGKLGTIISPQPQHCHPHSSISPLFGDGTDPARTPEPVHSAVPPPHSVVQTEARVLSSPPQATAISNGLPSAYTASSETGTATLRAEVQALQEEMMRLRGIEDEMHRMFVEPPPRYEE